MPNLYELNSYLVDHNLVRPNQDDWEVFQDVLRPFIDCWWNGAKPEFETGKTDDGTRLIAKVDGEIIIEMVFSPNADYPLMIKCLDLDTNEFDDDQFNYRYVSEVY